MGHLPVSGNRHYYRSPGDMPSDRHTEAFAEFAQRGHLFEAQQMEGFGE